MRIPIEVDGNLPKDAFMLVSGDSAVAYVNGETIGPAHPEIIRKVLIDMGKKLSEKGG